MHSVGDGALWTLFAGMVGCAFYIDLRGLLRDSAAPVPLRNALIRTLAWMMLALFFTLFLWGYLFFRDGAAVAAGSAAEFLTAYVLEKSLSFDNLFVILMIFRALAIPDNAQRRVLFWGVLGAAVLRFIVIFCGIWLVNLFHWLLYVFGFFILYSGVRILFQAESPDDPAKSPLFRWVSRWLPLTSSLHGRNFFVREAGKWLATPLFFALVVVEISDLIFATDSIPAVFAITLDPFIAFTSNLLAVLGLRAMYFLLAHAEREIAGLNVGIALVLMLTGLKMLANKWVHLPAGWMLLMIMGILLVTGTVGWIRTKKVPQK